MLSALRAFRSGYEGYIYLAKLRRTTVFLSSPTFVKRDCTHMATHPQIQPNDGTIRTVHMAEGQHHGGKAMARHKREHIRKLRQQGFQAREISKLACAAEQRSSPEAFAAMIEEDRKLAGLVQEVKPKEQKLKEWSNKEKEHLVKLTRNRRRIDIESIASQIGRKQKAVKSQLRLMAEEKGVELGNDTLSLSKEILNRNLNKKEKSVLKARMHHVIDKLRKDHSTTAQWRKTLRARSTKDWAVTILSFIPTRVKHIMVASCPPTAADWRSLTWQDTSSFGVYAWVLKRSKSANLNPIRAENHVYIGSATKYAHGLAGRILQHNEGKYVESDPGMKGRIEQRGLCCRTGHFATLLAMDPASSETRDITKARELVVFAKAIFTVWFGAFTETGVTAYASQHRRLHSFSPWDHPRRFRYKGLCYNNPLGLGGGPPGICSSSRRYGPRSTRAGNGKRISRR